MTSAITRIENGFAARRRLLLARSGVDAGEPLIQERPSIFAALASRKSTQQLGPALFEADEAWAFVVAILTAPTLSTQRALIGSIVPPQHAALVSCYALGALHGIETPTIEALSLLDATDFSIVAESMAIAGAITGKAAEACVRNGRVSLELDVIEGSEVGWRRLRRDLLTCAPSHVSDLTEFAHILYIRKREGIHYVGPDIFSVLQALLDPGCALIEATLDSGYQLLERWDLADLFVHLLLLRSLGPFPVEQAFLRARASRLGQSPGTRRAAQVAARLSTGRLAEIPPRPKGGTYIEAVMGHYARIKASIDIGDTSTLVDSVIDLFCVDRATMGFLPWDKISRALVNIPPRAAKTAFLTFLMTDEMVRSRYPLVALRLGKGAFMADLMGLLDGTRRTDPLAAVLTQVRLLPPKAAEALTGAVLDKPIIERLASSLPTPRLWKKDFSPVDRVRIIAMSVQALNVAHAKGLISDTAFRKRFDREITDLDFQLLQGQLRTGRVKVAWKELGIGLDELFDDALPITALELSLPPMIHDIVGQRLSSFSASLITDFAVDGSEQSLNQALSSHLRHGVLLPRVLRAFDDAMQAVWPRRPPIDWTDTAVQRRLGEGGSEILRLREQVSERVKRFMDAHLTMVRRGPLVMDLEAEVAIRIGRHFAVSGSSRRGRLRRSIQTAIKAHLGRFLTEARREFWKTVRRDTRSDLKALRKAMRGASSETRSYVDSLETYLFQGFDEARTWLAMARRDGPTPPFRLTELVNLHLLSSTLVAWNKLNITTKVTLNGADRTGQQINGKYLGLFQEVIRNLLSNAFRESGDSTKTEATIQLVVTSDRMVLRCDNRINPRKLAEVRERHAETVRQAQRRSTSQAAKDHRSGFQKIRLACSQAFGEQPEINIPPPAPRLGRFVVEIRLKSAPEDLFVRGGSR